MNPSQMVRHSRMSYADDDSAAYAFERIRPIAGDGELAFETRFLSETPEPQIQGHLRFRHHHSSLEFARRIVTEAGDLIGVGRNATGEDEDPASAILSEVTFINGTVGYPNLTFDNRTEFHDYLYRHSPALTAVYCIAYFLVFVIGLVGNCLVVAVVIRAPRMRTVTNLFIVNLAIADILVIVLCIPATLLSNIFVPWILGWWMCKTVSYVQGVSVAASVYSLIAVSLDSVLKMGTTAWTEDRRIGGVWSVYMSGPARVSISALTSAIIEFRCYRASSFRANKCGRFLAIWWPLKCQITKPRARFIIIIIWVVACTTTIPWALFFDLVIFSDAPDVLLCIEVWPESLNGSLYFLVANLVFCYILPLILISICYILIWIKVWTRTIPTDSKDDQMERLQQKSKVKVVKMLVVVVIIFVISWMPLYIIFARIKLGGDFEHWEENLLPYITPVAQWMGSSNSCINPILYAFFNKKYRRGFVAILKSKKCCGRLRYYETVTLMGSTSSVRHKSSYYLNYNASARKPPGHGTTVSYIFNNFGA